MRGARPLPSSRCDIVPAMSGVSGGKQCKTEQKREKERKVDEWIDGEGGGMGLAFSVYVGVISGSQRQIARDG